MGVTVYEVIIILKLSSRNNKSEWPSGLRRQTQGTALLSGRERLEISGPHLRAGVQIPFLTKIFFRVNNAKEMSVICKIGRASFEFQH